MVFVSITLPTGMERDNIPQWSLIEFQGELSGTSPGRPVGTLDTEVGTMALEGSQQEIKGKVVDSTKGGKVVRLVCRKKRERGADGDEVASIEVVGVVASHVVFLGSKK
eukprot:PhF_6_TR35168/c0_g1_i1/m.51231